MAVVATIKYVLALASPYPPFSSAPSLPCSPWLGVAPTGHEAQMHIWIFTRKRRCLIEQQFCHQTWCAAVVLICSFYCLVLRICRIIRTLFANHDLGVLSSVTVLSVRRACSSAIQPTSSRPNTFPPSSTIMLSLSCMSYLLRPCQFPPPTCLRVYGRSLPTTWSPTVREMLSEMDHSDCP